MSKKSIDLTFVRLTNAHSALVKRNQKAKAYSEECKRKRKRRNDLYDCVVLGAVLLFSIVTFLVCDAGQKANAQNNTTEVVEIETETELVRYKQIETRTEMCLVTNVVNDVVTITDKGEEYQFYGTGFKVGHELTCLFEYDFETCEWKVIDVLSIKKTEKVKAVLVGIDEETGYYEVSLPNGEIKTIPDAPEVYYTLELDANGNVISIEE